MPKSGNSSGCGSSNNNELFPPLNYSRSYFTQWLLKDTEDCLLWKDPPSHLKNSNNSTSAQQRHKSSPNVKRNNMELIQLLAINALEFTAPVYSFLNKDCNKPSPLPNNSSQPSSKSGTSVGSSEPISSTSESSKKLTSSTELSKELNREFIQLSGHPGSFAPAGPNSIWKKMPKDSVNEASVYEKLRDNSPDDPMKALVPTFISRTEWNGNSFIELEDLVTRFNLENLNIMDLKLGIRTFLESEVTNTKPRADLYEKMYKVDPEGPTEEEHVSKSVTKLRYMQFREELSSTKNLGFRIEGVKLREENLLNLQTIRDEHKISEILSNFVGEKKNEFVVKLKELRSGLEKSTFFMSHEIIGCSLLLIHDNVKLGAWIIDFAKTFEVEHNITHRAGWRMGNREDGVLTGIDNVIRILIKS